MSDVSDSTLGGLMARLPDHLRRHDRVYGLAGSFVAGLLLYGVLLGFRGFGPDALALVDAAEETAGLQTPHPFLELLARGLAQLTGGSVTAALRPIALAAAAGALPAIWGLGSRLGGWQTAAGSVVVFATIPAVAGTGTSIATGATFVFLWSWFLRLTVVERHRWYTAPLLWMSGAALLLFWPPFLVWGALWMYVELRESTHGSDAGDALRGEVPAGTIPVGIAVAPVAVVVLATLCHPALRAAPLSGWGQFFDHALRWTGPTFVYGGEAYAEARPPPWTGYLLYGWLLPSTSLLAAAGGWIWTLFDDWHRSRTGRLVQRMVLWGLPLAGLLPWLHRGIEWGALSFVLPAAPFLALCAGFGLSRLFDALRETRGGAIAAASAAALLGCGLVAVTYRAHPVQGSYYSALSGGFDDAVRTGLPVSRDEVYPLRAIRRAAARLDGGGLSVVGNDKLVSQYRRLGLLTRVRPAESPFSADGRVRRIGEFEPGSSSIGGNPHAMVDLTGDAAPLLSIDGVPIYWLEK